MVKISKSEISRLIENMHSTGMYLKTSLPNTGYYYPDYIYEGDLEKQIRFLGRFLDGLKDERPLYVFETVEYLGKYTGRKPRKIVGLPVLFTTKRIILGEPTMSAFGLLKYKISKKTKFFKDIKYESISEVRVEQDDYSSVYCGARNTGEKIRVVSKDYTCIDFRGDPYGHNYHDKYKLERMLNDPEAMASIPLSTKGITILIEILKQQAIIGEPWERIGLEDTKEIIEAKKAVADLKEKLKAQNERAIEVYMDGYEESGSYSSYRGSSSSSSYSSSSSASTQKNQDYWADVTRDGKLVASVHVINVSNSFMHSDVERWMKQKYGSDVQVFVAKCPQIFGGHKADPSVYEDWEK